jgi:hypothetical protein
MKNELTKVEREFIEAWDTRERVKQLIAMVQRLMCSRRIHS